MNWRFRDMMHHFIFYYRNMRNISQSLLRLPFTYHRCGPLSVLVIQDCVALLLCFYKCFLDVSSALDIIWRVTSFSLICEEIMDTWYNAWLPGVSCTGLGINNINRVKMLCLGTSHWLVNCLCVFSLLLETSPDLQTLNIKSLLSDLYILKMGKQYSVGSCLFLKSLGYPPACSCPHPPPQSLACFPNGLAGEFWLKVRQASVHMDEILEEKIMLETTLLTFNFSAVQSNYITGERCVIDLTAILKNGPY